MKKLKILYEDKYIIIVNKDAHILTIANLKEKYNTLYHEVSLYVKKQHKSNKIFIVHRLDKDTSGLVIFAKSEDVKRLLQNDWYNVKRGYIAIVNGNITGSNTIKSYLKETKTHYVYSAKRGVEAITNYESIAKNKLYSLLKITIETGRHHQIRVQLSDINHPIVGDKIYSKNKTKEKRLYLHAIYLEFTHPVTKEKIIINTNYPKEFNKLINYKNDIEF